MRVYLTELSLKFWLVLFFSALAFGNCKRENDRERLEAQINHALSQGKGNFAIAWKDLSTGESLLINPDTTFHAASTMKTPVMIEVFKQAAEDRFALNDSLTVKNQFYSIVDSSNYSLSPEDDSEHELYTQLGSKKTIHDLVYRMIIMSSNLATNIVINLVDAKKVTRTRRELGATRIEILRGVEDTKAYEAGLSNTTTAHDLLMIYEQLATGQLVSKQANQAMIEILLDQKFNEIIPAQLPSEIKVAHKTGSITGVHHDSGIIFLPDERKYVLILLSKNLKDFDHGTKTLANVSGMIYQYMVNGK
jgi:beta-lactamase class A